MELEIRNVNKKFKDKIAVNNASATLTPGVWGLLGANGAGKTTLIKMITGFGAVPSGTRKKTRTISINTNASTSIKWAKVTY
ncbi:ATP-binding cassette domain-containing protein [Anaerococcus provencensis]|uniref:ATP-binding cassette domain-containing protein n=1 Tax=Anaerococcus provencensis TaxID=938293 RepID=UPI000300BD04|nr:ATP-binding cassette domain-containing protein [Anaerococcus provencensis]